MNYLTRWFNRTRPPASDQEAKHRALRQRHALASVSLDHPLWVTVLEIVDEHERNMMQRAIEEKLSDGDRHYNAGLAASAEYLANALRDLKAQADREARQRQNAE